MIPESATNVNGPLNGVRILDLTHVWAGPLAVRILSDLGAEVVKVEAPFGRGPQSLPSEPVGGWLGGEPGDQPWNNSAVFVKFHRNRRSLCVDLKKGAGQSVLLELAQKADVLMENFSAGAMEAMGLDYDVLKKANPGIIYASITGYGRSGRYRERVAFGPVVESISGLTTMLGYTPAEPRNSTVALMDPVAASHAVAGVVSALRQRRETGEGGFVELSLYEGGVAYSGPWLLDRQLGGQPRCMGNRHPAMVPHGIYPCAGVDQWLALSCESQAQWEALCRVLASDGAAAGFERDWCLTQRFEMQDSIDTALCTWSANQDKLALSIKLQQAGVPAGPVNNAPEMVADPQVIHRGFFVPYERFATPIPGNPIHMAGSNSEEWTPSPDLGEHNREILTDWLGYDVLKINALYDSGVLLDRPPG